MKNYLSFRELDEIGECLIKTYMNSKNVWYENVDIEGFAKSLGLKIVNVCFAEADMNKAGFIADGESPLYIWVNDRIVKRVFPEKTVVVDKFLLSNNEQNRRRFLLAHEIAHYIINRINNKQVAAFSTEYDNEREYDINELKEMLQISESQADRLGAAMLMPRYLVERKMHELFDGKNIIMYGDQLVDRECKPMIKKLAESLGVSYQACFIRLKDLNLFEKRSMREYLEKNIGNGAIIQ